GRRGRGRRRSVRGGARGTRDRVRRRRPVGAVDPRHSGRRSGPQLRASRGMAASDAAMTSEPGPSPAPADRRTVTLDWLGTAAGLVLGGVLFVAGLAKIGDPVGSVTAVRAYQLLPESMERLTGYGLPFLEI